MISKIESKKKCILLILDGWGMPKDISKSAISPQNTPFFYEVFEKYPSTKLIASGEYVGLPENQMGNSEVGHITIGAGRIIDQSLQRISKSIKSKEFFSLKTTLDALSYSKKNSKSVHLIGLISNGGVHSHIDHIDAFIELAHKNGNEKVFLHAITDGRDCELNSGYEFLKQINSSLQKYSYKLATIAGRFYAMDRDNRWERTLAYFNEITKEKENVDNWEKKIENFYNEKIFDEFIPPFTIDNSPEAKIRDGDVVILCNFRADRMKQLAMLLQNNNDDIDNPDLNLYIISATEYDCEYKEIKPIFAHIKIEDSLAEVLSKNGFTQHKIAESEKYAHVTYFFAGGIEQNFIGETRDFIASPKVETYNLAPHMSAEEVKNKCIKKIKTGEHDFICVNFANADMVGHSGDFKATKIACNFLDNCLKDIVENAASENYSLIITADHGNADEMLTECGKPCTSHTLNLVPFILIDKNINQLKNTSTASLMDIAPTVLKILGIEIPNEMKGTPLF